MTNSIESKLIEMGGNKWEAGSHSRIYLNNWLELAGVTVSRYGTGNISGASFRGKKISNAKASELTGVKCFYDCNDGQIKFQGSARILDDIKPALIEAIDL